jgi:biotin transporter BioY
MKINETNHLEINETNHLEKENNSDSKIIGFLKQYKIPLLASCLCAVIGLILIIVTGNSGSTMRMTIGAMFGYSIGFLLLIPVIALLDEKL